MFFLRELPTRRMLQRYRDEFPEMETRDVAEALHLLRRASLLMRELEAYFAAHSLSQTRFLTLIVIDRELERDGLLPSEIADRLDVSRPVVTDTIRTLVKAGLLSVEGARDGRTKRVVLTLEGRAALARLLPGYFRLISGFMTRSAHRAP
ncbi:MarR family winged helix-turn-helix transcriptional regulator [Methylobacterium oxalidis]|uniref:MarR family winged helix-turn-helix transcriptional regulator n=1 Tax=Methylobacterium oxalidis TaxID=944322 RepID=UPI003316420A